MTDKDSFRLVYVYTPYILSNKAQGDVTQDINDGKNVRRAAVESVNKLGYVEPPNFHKEPCGHLNVQGFNTSVSNLLLTIFGNKSVQMITPEFAISLPCPTNVWKNTI